MTIGVGIIGAGGIAKAHAEAYKKTDGVEIRAVADVVPEAAQGLAQAYGCDAYEDYRELLKRSDIDAVSICTPHDAHAEVASASARAGKHILCEKPIATDVASGKGMVQEARASGVKLMVGQTHRFWPANIRARQLLEDGVVGDVITVSDTILAGLEIDENAVPWRMRRAIAGGGVFIDNGVHAVDRLRWWLGEVETVYAKVTTAKYAVDVENNGMALLQFEGGVIGEIRLSMTAPPAASLCRAEFLGTKGVLRVDTWGKISLALENAATWEDVAYDPRPGGMDREIEEFVAAIREDREPAVTGEDGLKSLEVVMAIYESARTGRVVKL